MHAQSEIVSTQKDLVMNNDREAYDLEARPSRVRIALKVSSGRIAHSNVCVWEAAS